MTNKKISALTTATVPLAGTEVIPLVQSGVTNNVSVSNLTAGRTVDAANYQVAATGNFKGVDDTSYVVYQATVVSGAAALYMSGSTRGGGLAGSANFACMDFNVYNPTFAVNKFSINGTTGDIGFKVGNLVQGTAAKGINFTANTPAAGMTSQLLNWYEEGTWTPDQGSGLVVVGAFSSAGRYTRIGRQVTVNGSVNGATSVSVGNGYATICSNLPFGAGSGIGTMNNAAANQTGVVLNGGNVLYSSSVMTATTSLAFAITYIL